LDLLRTYFNIAQDDEKLVDNLIRSVIFGGTYSALDLRKTLLDLRIHQLTPLMVDFLQDSVLQCFAFGNLLEDEMHECFMHVKSLINSSGNDTSFDTARARSIR